MTTATLIRQHGTTRHPRPVLRDPRPVRDEVQELWAMTAAQRVAAMWRGEFTLRQLSKWSSRAPAEVPLLGGEFAWIAMRMPEWAEPSQHARVGRTALRDQDVDQ